MIRLRPQIHYNLVLILNRRSLKTSMKASNWDQRNFPDVESKPGRPGCKPQRPCSKAESTLLWRRRDDDKLKSTLLTMNQQFFSNVRTTLK